MLRSSARRGFSASRRRPPLKRRSSDLRASAKATCPWCHGTLHGAAFSSRGFVPPDVAGASTPSSSSERPVLCLLVGFGVVPVESASSYVREATAPGTCQLLLRSRKPASAPDGASCGRWTALRTSVEDGGFAGPRLGLGRLGRDAEIQQLTDYRASPSLGPVLPATVIDDHSSCDDH